MITKQAQELMGKILESGDFVYNEAQNTALLDGVPLTKEQVSLLIRDELVYQGYLICDMQCSQGANKRHKIKGYYYIPSEKYMKLIQKEASTKKPDVVKVNTPGYKGPAVMVDEPDEVEEAKNPYNKSPEEALIEEAKLKVSVEGELELVKALATLIRTKNPEVGTVVHNAGEGWYVAITNEKSVIDNITNPEIDVRVIDYLTQQAQAGAVQRADKVRPLSVESELEIPGPSVAALEHVPVPKKKSPEAGNYFSEQELPVERG